MHCVFYILKFVQTAALSILVNAEEMTSESKMMNHSAADFGTWTVPDELKYSCQSLAQASMMALI